MRVVVCAVILQCAVVHDIVQLCGRLLVRPFGDAYTDS